MKLNHSSRHNGTQRGIRATRRLLTGVCTPQLLIVEVWCCAFAAGMYCLSAGGAGATSVLAAGIGPIFGTLGVRRCCARELSALSASHAVLPVEILHLVELPACFVDRNVWQPSVYDAILHGECPNQAHSTRQQAFLRKLLHARHSLYAGFRVRDCVVRRFLHATSWEALSRPSYPR